MVGRVRAVWRARPFAPATRAADLDPPGAVHGSCRLAWLRGRRRGAGRARIPRSAALRRSGWTGPASSSALRLWAARPGGARICVSQSAFGRLSPGRPRRLVIENDERWPLDRVLALAEAARSVPVVFDVFHPGSRRRCRGEGARRRAPSPARRGGTGGRQEVHFSTQDPGKRPARTRRRSTSERSCASPPRWAICRSTASSR